MGSQLQAPGSAGRSNAAPGAAYPYPSGFNAAVGALGSGPGAGAGTKAATSTAAMLDNLKDQPLSAQIESMKRILMAKDGEISFLRSKQMKDAEQLMTLQVSSCVHRCGAYLVVDKGLCIGAVSLSAPARASIQQTDIR